MKTYKKYIGGLLITLNLLTACSDDETASSPVRISTLITRDVYWDQATVKGNIESGQQQDIVEMGFYCDTTLNLINNPDAILLMVEGEEFIGTFNNLLLEKQYYVQAYVRTIHGETVLGNTAMFITTKVYSLTIAKNDPAYTNLTGRTVTLSGIVVEDSNIHIGYVGAKYWKANQDQSNAKEIEFSLHPETAPGNGEIFSIDISDLDPDTSYKAYVGARNSRGMVYSELIEFTTVPVIPATITTGILDIIGLTNATIVDNIAGNDGNDPQTTYGVYFYRTTDDGDTSKDSWIKIEGEPDEEGKFTCITEDLEIDTDYIVCGYATNYSGTALGEKIPFKTLSQQKPEVETVKYLYPDYFKLADGSDINLGLDYLYMRGIVTSTGGIEITGVGFEWGTSPTSLNNEEQAQFNSVDNSVSMKLSGLTNPGERIYYRAWAENNIGREYGTIESITIPVKLQGWKKDSDGKTTIPNSTAVLHYYELDAIQVEANEQYIFLDRNLGATERITNVYNSLYPNGGSSFVAGMFNTVGDYYKFGANIPVLTTDVNPSNSDSNWNDVADASVTQDGLDGLGNWTQSQPCPDGYIIPTADQLIKIMNKYKAVSSNVSEQFDTIKNDLNLQGTSFFRLQNGNYTLPNNYNQYSTYIPASDKNSNGLGQYLIIEYATSSNTVLGISMNNFSNANTQAAGLPVRCMRVETITP